MLTGGYIADEVRASVAAGEIYRLIERLIEKPWLDDALRATVRELFESEEQPAQVLPLLVDNHNRRARRLGRQPSAPHDQ